MTDQQDTKGKHGETTSKKAVAAEPKGNSADTQELDSQVF